LNLAQNIVIGLVRVYRLVFSPLKNLLLGEGGRCRFEPTCSQYAIEAIGTHGVTRGSWLAARRLCRCHPWGGCGLDPVPTIKQF
jgi:putative membrane protein insertion efficiency factor